jgi:hypothetical protein
VHGTKETGRREDFHVCERETAQYENKETAQYENKETAQYENKTEHTIWRTYQYEH